MKIDLTVNADEGIRRLISDKTAGDTIPPYALFGHLGTHFDVMDKTFSLDNTERRGFLFDVRNVTDKEIGEGDIDIGKIDENDFVIFYSGCLKEHGYGTSEYIKTGIELSNSLIKLLIDKRISMIGVDFPGIRKQSEHVQADQYCADNDVFVIENLANLDVLCESAHGKEFLVHTYPLNFSGLTGLPCRVVAEI
ncbi:MAG: cyclase family protein [Deferribacterales bacterium]